MKTPPQETAQAEARRRALREIFLLNRHKLSRIAALLALTACATAAISGLVLFVSLPSADGLATGAVAPSTIIYDRYGRVLYQIMDP